VWERSCIGVFPSLFKEGAVRGGGGEHSLPSGGGERGVGFFGSGMFGRRQIKEETLEGDKCLPGGYLT